MSENQKVYSVTDLNRYIENMFINEYALSVVFVRGEISNCTYATSGHIYFTLKDQTSQIQCVMFRMDAMKGLDFRLQHGMQVIVGGAVKAYGARGTYQIYAKRIMEAGAGKLHEQYEALKRKLEAAGYFDVRHKKKIPPYVKKVGIVTAATGAAIRDMQMIAHRRNPYVALYLYPAQVQGEGAAATIARGIRCLDQAGMDVIVIGRGGGSLEDLWAFNEWETAEAVFLCETPIVSAVGHESDTVLTDYVADLRASTPSAAMELVVFEAEEAIHRLEVYRMEFLQRTRSILLHKKNALHEFEKKLREQDPTLKLEKQKEKLHRAEEFLWQAMKNELEKNQQFMERYGDKVKERMEYILREKRHKMEVLAKQLDGLSPLKTMQTGYAFVEGADGKGKSGVRDFTLDEEIKIYVTDGIVSAIVTDRKEEPWN